jgi:hypothetical protein
MASDSAAPPAAPRRRRLPPNAFREIYLRLMDEFEDPSSATEADLDGPWVVAPCLWHDAPGHGLFRVWEDPERDEARAWFTTRELALVAAALLPAIGKDPWYELSQEATPRGHRLEQHGELVGYLPLYEDRLADGLHVAECLLRSPAALAKLLLGSSPLALRLTGAILARELEEQGREDRERSPEPAP